MEADVRQKPKIRNGSGLGVGAKSVGSCAAQQLSRGARTTVFDLERPPTTIWYDIYALSVHYDDRWSSLQRL